MLEYAVKQRKWRKTKKRPSCEEDIIWTLGRANSLADPRNDAIHAPSAIVTDGGITRIEPHYFFGHPSKWARASATGSASCGLASKP
jgi:hypothetical protein